MNKNLTCSPQSALVIGSANTAFDVIEDCYNAGIKTTMIQRSKTYLIPLRYHHDPRGLGIYDFLPPDVADLIVLSGPVHVGGQLLALTHAGLAAAEPYVCPGHPCSPSNCIQS